MVVNVENLDILVFYRYLSELGTPSLKPVQSRTNLEVCSSYTQSELIISFTLTVLLMVLGIKLDFLFVYMQAVNNSQPQGPI